MLATKYVILRKLESRGVQPGYAGPSAGEPSVPIAVDVESLTAPQAANVRRYPEVEALAPVIPMKLIAPVSVAASANQVAVGPAWGVHAVGADTSPYTGDGVRVAVLDTGIDTSHSAFHGIEFISRNFTTESDADLHGHGTHCAGTIFGRDVDGTRIGVAPGVRTAIIGKVLGLDGGGSDVILSAIQWALECHASVISMSLGIDFPGLVANLVQQGVPLQLATSMALEGYRANVLLFERLASLVSALASFSGPCTLIAAAGNESRRDLDSRFVIAVSPPAVADGIISVAAVGSGQDGLIVAAFSNTGARLAAPGVDIVSARLGGGLITMSGTSMATPHVAGVAALWAEKLMRAGRFTQAQFTDAIVGSAVKKGLTPDINPADIGNGIVRAPQD